RAYIGGGFPIQITGGSNSVRSSWQTLSSAGATAREMLIAAAAKQWGVTPSSCHAENGEAVHAESGRRRGYGALAEAASVQPVPKDVPLKKDKFKLLGKRHPRLDSPDKVTGKTQFGIDVKLPGMRVARVARCPVFGGKPTHWNAAAAKAVP